MSLDLHHPLTILPCCLDEGDDIPIKCWYLCPRLRERLHGRLSCAMDEAQECSQDSYTNERKRKLLPFIESYIFRTHPPPQSTSSKTEPNSGSNELALEQVNDCTEPCPYGSHKGKPIEQNNAYEQYCDGSHFLTLFFRMPL